MTQELWTKVDRYITELLLPLDSILKGVLEANAATGLPTHDGFAIALVTTEQVLR